MMATKEELKEKFVTGAVPTEEDFHDLIEVAGEQGPKGDPGKDGKDGEQGPQGEPGADGKDGEQGPAGKDAEPQFTEDEVDALKALIETEE